MHDPVTGPQLGVIDLSTTWDRTHPIGLATARVMARLIETAMPRLDAAPRARRRRRRRTTRASRCACSAPPRPPSTASRLLLNRRQTEILALLAMHPDGLSLDRLHALVYGDQAVTLSTLKAEVSHLRAALGGQLASRPYRLTMPVATDVDDVLDALRPRRRGGARSAAYGGDLLPGTELAGPRRAGRVRRGRRPRGPARRPAARRPWSATASSRRTTPRCIEVCLAPLGDRPHPAKPLLKGRLAVAGG